MRAAELVTATLILLVGLALVVESWKLGSGWGRAGPEAGFFPFCLGLLLSLTASALVVQAACRGGRTGPFLDRDRLALVAKVAGPAVGMVALTHVVGLYVATALYLAGYMRWIGRHSWTLVLIVSLGTPLLTFLIFEKWFLVPMPKGPLETWLGH